MSIVKYSDNKQLNNINGVFFIPLLIILTLTVYWQVNDFDFINYDDPIYVYNNAHIQKGLTLPTIKWAFSSEVAGNWHPITMLSHMVDCHFFGLNPGKHHTTNVIFHLVNTILLFYIFWRITGEQYKSFFIAALFAIHPLHVESVAWISERKDVLSVFFLFLTLWAYTRYIQKKTIYRYLIIVLFFAMGLMAKPMLVSLPCVLILFDIWPLKSIQLTNQTTLFSLAHDIYNRIFEKIPLFFLSAISCIVTLSVQQQSGAVVSFEQLTFIVRLLNAIVSYTKYIGKMIWPDKMAVFYPHPGVPDLWQVIISILLLLSLSFTAVNILKKYPYFAIGWLWYLGTLIPVIGLVQVGSQAIADRYTYIPYIGLSIVVTWGGYDLLKKFRLQKFAYIMAICIVIILSLKTYHQIHYWQNSTLLYTHTMRVTKNNYVAHLNLGNIMTDNNNFIEAIQNFKAAIRIKPDLAQAHNNLGAAYEKIENFKEAIRSFNKAIELKPDYAEAHNNIGSVYKKNGQLNQAITHLDRAIQINPNYAEAYNNMGNAFEIDGQAEKAITHYKKALNINPDFAVAYNNLGATMFRSNKIDEAIFYYRKALQIKSDSAGIYKNLGDALFRKKKIKEAIVQYKKALQLNPNFLNAEDMLGKAIQLDKKIELTIGNILNKMKQEPQNPDLPYQLAEIYSHWGEPTKASTYYQQTLLIQPNYVKALNALSILNADLKNYDQAILTYKKLLKNQPYNNTIQYNIACLYAIQGKTNQAIDWLQKAIDNGYKNWELIKTDNDLEVIRNTEYYKSLLNVNSK